MTQLIVLERLCLSGVAFLDPIGNYIDLLEVLLTDSVATLYDTYIPLVSGSNPL